MLWSLDNEVPQMAVQTSRTTVLKQTHWLAQNRLEAPKHHCDAAGDKSQINYKIV